ncbi:MAG: hypothetical protein IJU76_02750 [Desulfovibrionaceae bacterium]|nr:hypothetical protein [Desulfovibrionaceae bacterium]
MFTYDEYRRVYNLPYSQEVCDIYLTEGGLFKEYVINDYSSMKAYIETSIVANLAECLHAELTPLQARTITYAVLFKAICPSNLSNVPVLRESDIELSNFLTTMGIDINITIENRDLIRVADIFEHTGIIVRVKNFDSKSSIKERYYITNPSLASQLIKVAYGLTSLDDAILRHLFEACAMVQLTYHRILEHDIYFLDSEGRIAIPKKELDIVVIDNKREIVYLFECIHSQIH